MTAFGHRIPAMRALLVLAMIGCGSEGSEPQAPQAASTSSETENPEQPSASEVWVDVGPGDLQAALRAHEGEALLVNLWSTWCEPCVEEMPELVRTAARYEGRGLRLVLISADFPEQRDEARAFLDRVGAPTPSWFKTGSDNDFLETLHPELSGALPATLLLDGEREVVQVWQRAVTAEDLREPIEALLATEADEDREDRET